MIKNILAVFLLAASAVSQLTVPNPIISPSSPPISSEGHTPGEMVTLHVYWEGAADPSDTLTAPADAQGEAHFRPDIPAGLDTVEFSEGAEPTANWDERIFRHCVNPQFILTASAFWLIHIILFETEEEVYLMQHAEGGQQLYLFISGDGATVEYL